MSLIAMTNLWNVKKMKQLDLRLDVCMLRYMFLSLENIAEVNL